MKIETERLILREFTVHDSQFILELVNSDAWLKYIGDRNIKTNEQAINYLENVLIKSYRENRFGFGLVALKPDLKPIGLCGLTKRDHLPHIDIGFAFLPEYTATGFGYEIAKETLKFAFDQLQQEKIIAITLPINDASIKLLEKLGLKYDSKFVSQEKNEELLIYGISKSEHVALNNS